LQGGAKARLKVGAKSGGGAFMDGISEAAAPQIDQKAFWRILGMRAVGCAVVTAQDENGPAGFLALSATHLTPDPPTMMVSVGQQTTALRTLMAAGHFAINYLAEGSEDLVSVFGGRTAAKGAERFLGQSWSRLRSGAPILESAAGSLDCRLEEAIERHGTVIAIGRIVDFRSSERPPLISFAGQLGSFRAL
jgi:flavin reductase (DIM6/NTAB) family NADH-FMN oxidoreductase RutF